MVISVILAAGKGKRFNATKENKTAVSLNGKSLIRHAADLTGETTDHTTIVVGHKAESVINKLEGAKKISFAFQKQRLGTGHALKVALKQIALEQSLNDQDSILVGYADHMFLYTPTLVREMIKDHSQTSTAITLVTTTHPDPNFLSWGRIIRSSNGLVERIVEQRDASNKEKKITELNAGLYLFNYGFLQRKINKLRKSPYTGEYYLTDLIAFAVNEQQKVLPYLVEFSQVGFGMNTPDQLKANEKLLKEREVKKLDGK